MWYHRMEGQDFQVYDNGRDYILKEDKDKGYGASWRHISKDDCLEARAHRVLESLELIMLEVEHGEFADQVPATIHAIIVDEARPACGAVRSEEADDAESEAVQE